MEEKKELKLIKLGFKRKWYDDKSGYWWVKNVKINGFKGYFYYDSLGFYELYIKTFELKNRGVYEEIGRAHV